MKIPIRLLLLAGLFSITLSACEPPQPVDAPATDLDVKILILDDEAPEDGKVLIVVTFSSGGKPVVIGGGATVSANSLLLSDAGNGIYNARVPQQAPGASYVITYTRDGTSTSVSVSVPSRPDLRSPVAGATVPRTANLTLTYVAGSGTSVQGSAGEHSTGLVGDDQPDDGAYENLDVSSLSPGPGSVGITRKFEFPVSGTGFHSAKVTYNVSTDKPVTWSRASKGTLSHPMWRRTEASPT